MAGWSHVCSASTMTRVLPLSEAAAATRRSLASPLRRAATSPSVILFDATAASRTRPRAASHAKAPLSNSGASSPPPPFLPAAAAASEASSTAALAFSRTAGGARALTLTAIHEGRPARGEGRAPATEARKRAAAASRAASGSLAAAGFLPGPSSSSSSPASSSPPSPSSSSTASSAA